MPSGKLKDTFESFNQQHVLIIGDIMVDSYLWGDVSRISPEAPVPIIAANARENRLGGAANVALNILALGAKPILCAVVGQDEHGRMMKDLLEEKQLSSEGIISSPDRKTTVKTRIISQNHHLLRVDEEMDAPVSSDISKELFHRVQYLLNNYRIDAIVFEDYDKGVITPQLIESVIKEAQQRSIPTLVDPKKRNFMDYKGVTFFKPNFKEFKEGLKLDISKPNKETIIKASTEFRDKQNIRMVMVTMAENGVFIGDDKGETFIPAEVRDIADVSGAGDTVISVSALCLAAGLPAHQVARIANMAGGLVCEMPGVVPVKKELLLNECIEKGVLAD